MAEQAVSVPESGGFVSVCVTVSLIGEFESDLYVYLSTTNNTAGYFVATLCSAWSYIFAALYTLAKIFGLILNCRFWI